MSVTSEKVDIIENHLLDEIHDEASVKRGTFKMDRETIEHVIENYILNVKEKM